MFKLFLLYPYYLPHYKAGGPVQSLFNLVSTLKDDAEFYLLSNSTDIDGSVSATALPLNKWVKGDQNENIFYTATISPVLVYRLLKEVNPDAVMVNGIFNISTTLPGILAAKWLGIKVVISPRGMLQPWGLKRGKFKKKIFLSLLKMILKKDEQWHATDENEKSDIQKIFGSRQVIHVASNVPRPALAFQPLSFPDKSIQPIRLVFLSLINPNKNLHLIIDAVKKNLKFCLDIYGPVANNTYWSQCQEAMKGTDSIYYRGSVSPLDVPTLLSQYHFFILPTQGENFGHAIFDALSSSVPVIISRNTPWKNIDSTNAGFYIEVDNENSIKKTLTSVSNLTDEKYEQYRKGAHTYAVSYWKSRDFLNEYRFLFEE